MRRMHSWFIALALALPALLMALPAQAESLAELVKRADLIFRGDTSAAVLQMEVKTKSYHRSYKIVSWDDARKGDRSLIKILGPAAWRGHATLKIGDKLKLFNPKTNHVQVVGHSMLGNSWMGSHFSNDDLVKETRLARDYKLKLAKKWKAKAPNGERATFYRVSMTPRPTAPVAWGRIVYELWDTGKSAAPTKAEYYRKAGDKKSARVISFTDLGDLGGRIVPRKMTVRVARKPGEYTRITYKKLKLNIDIPARKFSEQAMRH
jgi:hypothetical protein